MGRLKHQIQPAALPVTADGLRRNQLALEALIVAAGASGVTTFNTRAGVVTLTSGDVTTALGFTPSAQETGWGAYFHTGAAQAILANTAAALANNAGSVIEAQKPADVGAFYSAGKVTGRDGDGIALGIEFSFTPSSAAASMLSLGVDIGGSVGEIFIKEYPITRGSGVAHKISYNITAYTLTTWAANGGTPTVLADGPGSITGARYVIHRLHKAR